MNLIKLALVSIYHIILLTVLAFVILVLVNLSQNVKPISNFSSKAIQRLTPYTGSMKDRAGNRYCSSVSINYKGVERTLTNMHCCEADSDFEFGLRRIENRLEQIIFISQEADVCVLTSSIKSKIKLSDSEFKRWDAALVMGYPLGFHLTPREGYVTALLDPVSVNYGDYVLTTPSNWITALTFPGNSGSGVFNTKGELVNLIYAGPDPLMLYGISVPHQYLRNALDKSL